MLKLKREIIEVFRKKTGWKPHTVIDNVSRFKIKECPRSTQNAAAHVLALTRNFSCAQKLDKEDRDSLPHNLSEILEKYKPSRKVNYKIVDLESHARKTEKKIKQLSNQIEKEALKNSIVYPKIYILENTLRKLILKQLGNDASWWKTPHVKPKIIEYANQIKENEKETPWIKSKGDHPIYYVTLEQLCSIIRINWTKFKNLGEQNNFFARFEDIYPIRNSLAHNIPLTERDRKEIDVVFPKICKIIETQYGV